MAVASPPPGQDEQRGLAGLPVRSQDRLAQSVASCAAPDPEVVPWGGAGGNHLQEAQLSSASSNLPHLPEPCGQQVGFLETSAGRERLNTHIMLRKSLRPCKQHHCLQGFMNLL